MPDWNVPNKMEQNKDYKKIIYSVNYPDITKSNLVHNLNNMSRRLLSDPDTPSLIKNMIGEGVGMVCYSVDGEEVNIDVVELTTKALVEMDNFYKLYERFQNILYNEERQQ